MSIHNKATKEIIAFPVVKSHSCIIEEGAEKVSINQSAEHASDFFQLRF